jgi:hypothetical protein
LMMETFFGLRLTGFTDCICVSPRCVAIPRSSHSADCLAAGMTELVPAVPTTRIILPVVPQTEWTENNLVSACRARSILKERVAASCAEVGIIRASCAAFRAVYGHPKGHNASSQYCCYDKRTRGYPPPHSVLTLSVNKTISYCRYVSNVLVIANYLIPRSKGGGS